MPFIRFFINQRLFINLLSILLIILGYFSLASLNRERFPVVDLDIVVIAAIYPGAAPEEMENLVMIPIEDVLKGAEGIEELESYSVDDRMGIVVYLQADLKNRQAVIDEIRRLVEGIQDFPADMEKPVVREITSHNRPVGSVVISAIANDVSYRELRELARTFEDGLKRVRGVSGVTSDGFLNREFRVELKPHTLIQFGIGMDQIFTAIAARNTNLPVGKVISGGREIILKTPGKVKTITEIGNIVVQANEEGHVVRLKRLARIIDDFEEPLTFTRVNGNQAIILTVLKKYKYDTIKAIANIEKHMTQFSAERNSDGRFDFRIINNSARRIQTRINVLASNAYMGIGLVLLILLIFLNWRIALITGVGIPLAFGLTFVLMKLLGYNLDLLTLLGLIVVVGMIVDDAIIVAENIFRHIEMGLSPKEAAIKGTSEVIMPVAATILTSIAAFTPLLFMEGIRGKFTYFIAIIVVLALLASWLESMLALPAHMADFARPIDTNRGKLRRRIDSLFLNAKNKYVAILRVALRHRIIVIGVMLLLVTGSFYLLFSRTLPFISFPRDGVEKFMLGCKAPQGTELRETAQRMKKIENFIVGEIPGVKDYKNPLPEEELLSYQTTVGVIQRRPGSRHAEYGSRYAVMIINLTGHTERERSARKIIKSLKKKIKPTLKNTEMECRIKRRLTGGARTDSIEIQIIGDDPDMLEVVKKKIYRLLDRPDKNYIISDDAESRKAVLNIDVSQETLAIMGLDNRILNNTLRTAYEGAIAANLRIKGEEVKIRLIFPEDKRNHIDSFKYIHLTNRRGALVPLSRMTKISKSESLSKIVHKNWQQTLTIDVDAKKRNTSASLLVAELKESLQPIISAAVGYRIEFAGRYKEERETQSELLHSFYIALLIIFLILVTLFKSFFQPIIVMAAIPLGFVGAILTLLLHDRPMSFMAGIGYIGLVGVVVNDSLIMVEFMNKTCSGIWIKFKAQFETAATREEYRQLKREWNSESLTAVVSGAELRFRPVLLTTITTFFGLLPTAYGIGGDDPYIKPLALVFAWGLFFATANTLIVIPGIYLIYLPVRFRLSYLWSQIKRKIAGFRVT